MTDVAHEKEVLRPFPHKLSALAVVGASEKKFFLRCSKVRNWASFSSYHLY